MVMLNTTTQPQNTTISNIFNLTSQLMEMTTGTTVGESNSQNNATSNLNTRGRHFSHFRTIGANLFREFGTFGNNNNNPLSENNNNNNLSLPLLPLSGFEEGLKGDFNLPSRENAKGLDSNVTALVNTSTGVNLGINYVERESNHVKPMEFEGTEAEDPNEWLECYNRIAEANKWSEYRRF